jgi:hypothetical protein
MIDFRYISVSTAAGQSATFRDLCYKGTVPQGFSSLSEALVMPESTNGIFSVNKRTGQLAISLPILDFETTPIFSVKIQVSDGKLSSISNVRIYVVDRNEAPKIEKSCTSDTSVDQCRVVLENAGPGTLVGVPLIASDQDSESYAPSSQTSHRLCDVATGIESLQLIQVTPGVSKIPHDVTEFIKINAEDDRITPERRLRQGSGKVIPNDRINLVVPNQNVFTEEKPELLIDGKRDEPWISSPDLNFQRIELRLERSVCVDEVRLYWDHMLNAKSIGITIYDNNVGSKVYTANNSPNMLDHIDIIKLFPTCGNMVAFDFNDYYK